jgi:hypothetical protein
MACEPQIGRGPERYGEPRGGRPPQEHTLATPNYAYEKRQRELAKKRKNEEKLQRKTHRGPGDGPAANDQGGPAPSPQPGDGSAPKT